MREPEETREEESEPVDSLSVSEGPEHQDELEVDGVPPYEDRLGPDGAEGENPVLPQRVIITEEEDAQEESQEEQDENYDSVPGSLERGGVLPWGAPKERVRFPSTVHIETDIKPGEFVMRTLFAEFTIQAERKITSTMMESMERALSKSLQRGEDPHFDQLLSAFGSVAEHCLPSLLKTLIAWYEKQGVEWIVSDYKPSKSDSKGKSELSHVTEMEFVSERRDLAVEFIFCLVLIEVLKQLHVHPGHEDLVRYIESLCFRHFKYRGPGPGETLGPNAASIHTIADLYAEVLGVLASSRFQSVRKRFTCELRELRSKESTPQTIQAIISLLMGMKFFRVKMVPIEEFEVSFQFMQECGTYFLEVKEKDIKHAMAGLFVEILVPVAASVKHEVNVPCLKNFVDMLYSQTLDMCTKTKHRLALFPLVTCLLCVSQKTFFLNNWHYFLTMCLQHLKNKDPKLSRVALESLYRLLWVYMIRIKCESNNVTQSRLQSIVNSLFPKGSKTVVPRDTPLNIFVKIIQFISQEKLDFAMREIIFDLLSVARPIKFINAPERMSIGLRAFLVVADSLQQKEGEPPMPRTVGVLPSGSTLRVKKTFLNKMLTEDAAKSIGISPYYPYVRKVFDDILRALDSQFGKPFMLTNSAGVKADAEDAKPKLDLFRTVIAAIPRLIPDGMSRSDLVETLARLTVHTDDEIRVLSCQALQNLVIDFPDWREDVLWGFMQFFVKEIPDLNTNLLDNGIRMTNQLLGAWRSALERVIPTIPNVIGPDPTKPDAEKPDIFKVLCYAEGIALTMLCHIRLATRKLAVHMLKEVKGLLKLTGSDRGPETAVIDAMDQVTQEVVEQYSSVLPLADKNAISNINSLDLQWLADRNSVQWTSGFHDDGTTRSGSTQQLFTSDPWSTCLLGFLEHKRLPKLSPSALLHTWPIIHTRLTQLYPTVQPLPVQEQRSSLFPGTAPKKPANERDISLHLWKNYISFACRVVPTIPAASAGFRCVSPDLSLPHLSSSPESLSVLERQDSRSPISAMLSPSVMYKLLIPLLRCEVPDMRDSVVLALGNINHHSLMDLLGEKTMLDYIREALDRAQKGRRRRQRDLLRLQLVRVFELISKNGTFSRSHGVIDENTESLAPIFIEYIGGVRELLEAESDKDSALIIKDIKVNFIGFIKELIGSFQLDKRRTLIRKELRRNLFNLFAGWSGRFGQIFGMGNRNQTTDNTCTEFEFSALQAMLSVLCSGPCFDINMFSEDGEVYKLLDLLLASEDPNIYSEGQKAVVLLLEVNPDLSTLLDWVVDRCYTGSNHQADGCFLALATIFSTREYPCDHYTAIINVTLMNCGCPRTLIHETALQLLQILDNRFFGTVLPLGNDDDLCGGKERSTLDVLLSTTYSRSQLYLSRQLSQLHPELTMPMFSEISSRLQTARPVARQNLLQYLLPWLYNMELVDPNIPPHPGNYHYPYYQSFEMSRPGVRREGWGSAEATEMVTNNMFYITCRFGDDHPKEVEELWSALCACWPNNLRVIVRYLLIVSGMAPNLVLDYSKRVILYLGRSQPVRTLDEIMLELQTVETFNVIIERTETPPYYRLTNLRKASSNLENNTASDSNTGTVSSKHEIAVEKGTIHTKRHSQEDPGKEKTELSLAGSLRSAGSMATSAGSAIIQKVAEKARALSGSPMSQSQIVQSQLSASHLTNQMSISQPAASTSTWKHQSESSTVSATSWKPTETTSDDHITNGGRSLLQDQTNHEPSVTESLEISVDVNDPGLPHPLPMPEFGGWFAPLTEFLPDPANPIANFHRCNLAMILLTDLVVDGLDLDCHSVDWSVHMPLMLHIIFLGLDNNRPLVHQHCKQLLLNLLVVLGGHGDHLSVASVLLNNKTTQMDFGLSHPSNTTVIIHNFLEVDDRFDSYLYAGQNKEDDSDEEEESQASRPGSVTSGHGSMSSSRSSGVTFSLPAPSLTVPEVLKALIQFIASKKTEGVLWQYEDTTKNFHDSEMSLRTLSTVRSGEQMGNFLQHVLRVFQDSLPHAHLPERWAQLSIQLALSCSSRHFAGRSLQIFRSLRVPITSRVLSDILSRLVETIAEQGEDMQGYVTELILTLEAVVDTVDSNFKPMDLIKEIFKSTPNLKEMGGVERKGGVGTPSPLQHAYHASAPPGGPYHTRSTSYGMSQHQCKKSTATSPGGVGDARGRSSAESENKLRGQANLPRSRSAQSLKMQDETSEEDKMNILVQLFWICIAILESDYEHEFILGLRLLDKVLTKLPLDRPDTREKVEKIQSGLKWPQFPGLHSLLLKGCTNPNTYEPTIALLSRLTVQLDLPVVDPTQSLAFPMNVIALLPYLVINYEDANDLCITSAKNIAHVSTEKSKKLENLSTVMTLYSRRTFSKESFQWTKCVVKYLYDSYSHLSLSMLSFLVEVLEKGPPSVQPSILTIIHCMAHYVDLQSTTQTINSDLMRAVSKFVETPHWKEALKILKLAVTRSSTLVAPPSTSHTPSPHLWEAHAAFTESDLYFKKELPGRTMEFTFDLSQTPVIERRHRRGLSHFLAEEGNSSSPRRSLSLSTADSGTFSGWKRPWMSQSRVRECLVNLLNTCGQKVGLPKSPSVIFSQTSELLERQSSMASSTECVSGPGNDTEQSKHDTTDTEQKFGMYMRDFDFLEYELESLEGESVDNFNWGVRRPSITNLEEDAPRYGIVSPREFDNHHLPLRKRAVGGVGAEESSDDEVESVSPIDDMSGRSNEEQSSSVSTTSSGVFPPTSLPLDRIRSSTPASETESGECSDGELSDLTPCNPSPSLSQLMAWTTSNTGEGREMEELEERWRCHVQSLMQTSSQHNLLNTFSLFARLFRDVRSRTVVLTEDSCSFLSREAPVQPVHSQLLGTALLQFRELLAILATVPDCPLVWCDFSILADPRLTERLKFNVLEIQENFENYVDKKDNALSCLEGLRAQLKLISLGEPVDASTNIEMDEVELARYLYRLHFQQLLLLESYTKLLQLLSSTAANSKIQDMSTEVAEMKVGLTEAARGPRSQPSTPNQTTPLRASSPSPSPVPSSYTTSPLPPASPVPSSSQPVSPAPTPSPIPSHSQNSSPVHSSRSPHPASPSQPSSRPASPVQPSSRHSSPDHPASPVQPSSRHSSPDHPASPVEPSSRPSSPPRSPSPLEEGEPTPTASWSDAEEGEISHAPFAAAAALIVPEICVTPPPRTPSPKLSAPVPLPTTESEASELIVQLLETREWNQVWRVWKECPHLLLQEVPEGQIEEDQISEILNFYCSIISRTKEGVYVMTVGTVELVSVCSRLMDISLQLLASVKQLEKSIHQRGRESPNRVESSL